MCTLISFDREQSICTSYLFLYFRSLTVLIADYLGKNLKSDEVTLIVILRINLVQEFRKIKL